MRHEYGHFIDFELPSETKQFSMGKFKKAYFSDLDVMIANRETKNMKWYADRYKGVPEMQGVSDIVDAMSGGLFRDRHRMWGHGQTYYRRESMRMTETFANTFEAWSVQGEAWAEIQTQFPNIASTFDEIMEGILNENIS